MDNPHRYDDMLDMPHHVSPTRPRMSRLDRAAQFAPFAALTGFGAAITEADRMPERRIELGEAETAELAEMYLRSEINIWENIQNVAEGWPNSAKYAPPPTRSGSAAAPRRSLGSLRGLVALALWAVARLL